MPQHDKHQDYDLPELPVCSLDFSHEEALVISRCYTQAVLCVFTAASIATFCAAYPWSAADGKSRGHDFSLSTAIAHGWAKRFGCFSLSIMAVAFGFIGVGRHMAVLSRARLLALESRSARSRAQLLRVRSRSHTALVVLCCSTFCVWAFASFDADFSWTLHLLFLNFAFGSILVYFVLQSLIDLATLSRSGGLFNIAGSEDVFRRSLCVAMAVGVGGLAFEFLRQSRGVSLDIAFFETLVVGAWVLYPLSWFIACREGYALDIEVFVSGSGESSGFTSHSIDATTIGMDHDDVALEEVTAQDGHYFYG